MAKIYIFLFRVSDNKETEENLFTLMKFVYSCLFSVVFHYLNPQKKLKNEAETNVVELNMRKKRIPPLKIIGRAFQ